jgi:hypothetical protein
MSKKELEGRLQGVLSLLRLLQNELNECSNYEASDKVYDMLRKSKLNAITLTNSVDEARCWNSSELDLGLELFAFKMTDPSAILKVKVPPKGPPPKLVR